MQRKATERLPLPVTRSLWPLVAMMLTSKGALSHPLTSVDPLITTGKGCKEARHAIKPLCQSAPMHSLCTVQGPCTHLGPPLPSHQWSLAVGCADIDGPVHFVTSLCLVTAVNHNWRELLSSKAPDQVSFSISSFAANESDSNLPMQIVTSHWV